MTVIKLPCAIFAALFAGSLPAASQQPLPSTAPPGSAASSDRIQLSVTVDSKSGQPINFLHEQDFTILDNKSPRPITSFKVVTSAEEPVEVILFIDAVNTPYELTAFMRNSTESFLKENEGTLAHPTAIAVFTDNGVKIQPSFSTNGLELSGILESQKFGLREINRSSQWSDVDRLNLSINALHQLVSYAATLPGRKIAIWISPGFPLLSGPGVNLSFRQEQQIFSDVLYFSSTLRENDIALYNVNPVGVSEPVLTADYYLNFAKGIARPQDAQLADLSIQVLSAQSGGLTFTTNNDFASQIRKCLLDAASWYEITFDPSPPDKPNQYHHIEVRLDQPGLIARTSDGYYSNPVAAAPSR